MKFPRRVEYARMGGMEFWEKRWRKQDIKKRLEQVEKDPVTMIVHKWIEDTTVEKEHPKILDGGCGTGRHLIYFGKLGYDITGVDFSTNAIEAVKQFDNNLRVTHSSVLDLPFAPQSFDYYFSFGVLEHSIDGPEQGLREAQRVLKEGGILFLSVPYMNYLRLLEERLKALGRKSTNGQGESKGSFYQYYFTKKELYWLLTSLGFKVLRHYPLNQELGLLRVLPFSRKNRILNYLVINLAKMSKFFIPNFCAHKMLLICKKVS